MNDRGKMYDFEITIRNYWDDSNFSRIVRAKSAGEAKYNYWLKFNDVYNMTFGEFLRIIKCRKVG